MQRMDNQNQIEWQAADKDLVDYAEAVTRMERRVADIRAGVADELVWLVEHPPLYTAGTSASDEDLIDKARFPVYRSGRGGQYTYHGPGQRVAYVMLDLNSRGKDVRGFVDNLEQWIINTLAAFGVTGERRDDRVGVWVVREGGREDKVAAIGVRVRKWVTYHGISINLNPELAHYAGIVPCGIGEHGVTSLRDLGLETNMAELDRELHKKFTAIFG